MFVNKFLISFEGFPSIRLLMHAFFITQLTASVIYSLHERRFPLRPQSESRVALNETRKAYRKRLSFEVNFSNKIDELKCLQLVDVTYVYNFGGVCCILF